MTYQTLAPKRQRADWEQGSALLDVLEDNTPDIVAFLEHCDASDLHEFNQIHGRPHEVDIFRAILEHSECDRSTALNIFHACDPQYYEQEFANGRARADLTDEEDVTYLEILDMAHAALCARPNWRGRFACNALAVWHHFPDRSPDGFHTWPLPAAVLTAPEDEPPVPTITYCFSTIRLSYTAWALQQSQESCV